MYIYTFYTYIFSGSLCPHPNTSVCRSTKVNVFGSRVGRVKPATSLSEKQTVNIVNMFSFIQPLKLFYLFYVNEVGAESWWMRALRAFDLDANLSSPCVSPGTRHHGNNRTAGRGEQVGAGGCQRPTGETTDSGG